MPETCAGPAGLWQILRPHIGRMAAGSLLGLATLVCGIGLMALSGWFISATASAGLAAATAHLFNFFHPSIGVRLFAFGRTAGRYGERIIAHDATFRILEGLRVWFYRRLEPLAPAGLSRWRSADVLNRIVADIDALDNLYLRVLSPGATALAAALLTGLFLAVFDVAIALWVLGLLLAAGVGVPAAAAHAGAAAGRQLARRKADLRVQVVEGLQGMAELLVFGAHARHREGVLAGHRALVRLQGRMSHIRGASGALVSAVSGAAVIAVLYLGVERVGAGQLAGPHLVMAALAAMAVFEAVAPLPGAFQYLGQTREAGRRLLEIVSARPPVRFPAAGAAVCPEPDLALEEVTFRYGAGEPPALENVSLHIPFGQRVAVLGAAGAGKSTLAHLLVRFQDPSSGRVVLGGRDIREIGEPDLRRSMAVVSQRAHIFTASVRDNLLIARPEADDAALRAALDGARMRDFVEGLPDGLDTWVGEAGKLLSGGQARRLAVARAILRDAPLWILDEPGEGLDRETERALLRSVLAHTRGRTVLLITHRGALLEEMDRIVVLAGGRVAAWGTHASLLAAYAPYAAFYRDLG